MTLQLLLLCLTCLCLQDRLVISSHFGTLLNLNSTLSRSATLLNDSSNTNQLNESFPNSQEREITRLRHLSLWLGIVSVIFFFISVFFSYKYCKEKIFRSRDQKRKGKSPNTERIENYREYVSRLGRSKICFVTSESTASEKCIKTETSLDHSETLKKESTVKPNATSKISNSTSVSETNTNISTGEPLSWDRPVESLGKRSTPCTASGITSSVIADVKGVQAEASTSTDQSAASLPGGNEANVARDSDPTTGPRENDHSVERFFSMDEVE